MKHEKSRRAVTKSQRRINKSKLFLYLFAVIILLPIGHTSSRAKISSVEPERADRRAQLAELHGRLPISFEANEGQSDSRVKYLSRGAGYGLYLTSSEAILSLQNGKDETSLSMSLVGAKSSPRIQGLDKLKGKSNYFVGHNARNWRRDVSHYSKVLYEDVYPGIDLIFYGSQRNLEYDFVLSPGADARKIELHFTGVDSIEIDGGDLLLRVSGGLVRQHRPIAYQLYGGEKRIIDGEYFLKSEQRVGFRLGEYDRNRTLFIDPILSYSTYLGGDQFEMPADIAVDAEGSVYVTGLTNSTDFPTTDSVQPEGGKDGGGQQTNDIFVTKLSPGGDQLIYSTYLGGNDYDESVGIAVDTEGNAYIAGYTDSTNFPTASPMQAEKHGFFSAGFVTKINADGDALLYSTYLTGTGQMPTTIIRCMAVDPAGSVYIAGVSSEDFPITENAFQKSGHGTFIAKLNPAGSAFEYSTRLTAPPDERGKGEGVDIKSIAVDAEGNAYVTGKTSSPNLPLVNPFQAKFSHEHTTGNEVYTDAFVTKLNASGSGLVYSTYLGSDDSNDVGEDIAVDAQGNAYITGSSGLNFPTTPGAFKMKFRSMGVFIAKLDASGSSLLYSTIYAGGYRIAVDADGFAYVTGGLGPTTHFDFRNSFQSTVKGGSDLFITKLNRDGTAPVYSTVMGGKDDDHGYAIAVDNKGNAFVIGDTKSTDFPILNAVQPSLHPPLFSGGTSIDNFIVKVNDPDKNPASIALLGPQEAENVPRNYTIRFTGEDADGLAGYILAYSIDNGNSFRDIARVSADKNSVIWNAPERVNSYTRIRLTAVDRLGNTSSVASDYFHVQPLSYPYRPPIMGVTLKVESPTNQSTPRIASIDARQVLNDEYPATYNPKSSIAPPKLTGYNFYRIPYPESGGPLPSAAEIVRPENLVGSIPADSNVYTDTPLVYGGINNGSKIGEDLPGNYIYSVTSISDDGRESPGSNPISTGLPAIIDPDFRNGTIYIQARGSLIEKGARLLINQRYSYKLSLDETRSFFTVNKDKRSSVGDRLIKEAIKKKGAVELIVINPNGKTSARVIFSRGYY